jgi:integrase/recombinase XerD
MSASTHLPRTLEPAEVNRLLGQASPNVTIGLRNRCLLHLMLHAGLKAGEVVALKPEHFDPLTCRLQIREGRGAMERTLKIPRDVRDLIVRWADVRPESEWLFATRSGKPLDTRYLRRMVKRYATDAGVTEPETVSPQVLRYTFGVEQLRKNDDLDRLKRVLGYRHRRSTSVYADLLAAERERTRAVRERVTAAWHDTSATQSGGQAS